MRSLILFLYIIPVCVLHAETMQWATPDFAPAYTKDGSGYVDHYLKIIQKKIPEYEHKIVRANFSRTVELMRSGQNICSVSMFKTPERERVLNFSSPYILIHANSLIMTQEGAKTLKSLDKDGKIDLEKFLQNKHHMGLSSGRSYGPHIDSVIHKFIDTDRIDTRGGNDVFAGLFGMIGLGRLDAILGFRAELDWFSKKSRIKKNLVSFPLQGEQEYFLGYAACSKSEWGNKMIVRLEKILSDKKLRKEFYNYYLDYVPEVDRAAYAREAHKILGTD